MRIAVVSDTHLSAPTDWLERAYATYLAPADAVVHCGDMTGRSAWSFFLQHPCFYCVQGNMDDYQLAVDLPPRLELELAGLKVVGGHRRGCKAGLSAGPARAPGGRAVALRAQTRTARRKLWTRGMAATSARLPEKSPN